MRAPGDATAGRVAGYELVRPLGAGGMGVVWEAWQRAPRRRVALKLLRAGLPEREAVRLRREAEALARLDHPGIARVYESGVEELAGVLQPFLAMELVEGERIDAWLAARGASDAERLELVARVCDAVQHAHEAGVVHRDLKPANVLVDREGRPRVLDFGVARVAEAGADTLSRAGASGELAGTLSYMSPEQVTGDGAPVDARSDVYALGVLAYELLCGEAPWSLEPMPLAEALRALVSEEPTTLGSREARWRGDVDVLVGTAMAKERSRRYASAADFAADVRRHLAGEPIVARPLGRLARSARFARRNRLLVGGALAVFLVLAAAIAVSGSLFLRARAESRVNEELSAEYERVARENAALAERFRTEAETANQTVAFLARVFQGSDPLGERELSARDLVEEAAARVRDELGELPEVRCRLLSLLGKAYLDFGMPSEAKPLLEEALELGHELYAEDTLEHAQLLERASEVARRMGHLERAERGQRRVLAIRQARLGEVHPDTVGAWNNLGNTLSEQGRTEEAMAAYEKAVAIDELLGERGVGSLWHRINRALEMTAQGRYQEAEERFRELFEDSADDPGFRTVVMTRLGGLLRVQRRHEEAEAWLQDAVSLARSTFGTRSWTWREACHELANGFTDTGRLAEAEAILRELAATAEQEFGPDGFQTLTALHDLAYCLHEDPDWRAAERVYLDALARARGRAKSARTEMVAFEAQVEHNLGALYSQRGMPERAAPFARDAYELRLAFFGPEHPNTRISEDSLATIAGQLEQREASEELRREALEHSIEALGPAAVGTQHARVDLASVLLDQGRTAEARALLEEARRRLGEMPEPAGLEQRIGEVLARVGGGRRAQER